MKICLFEKHLQVKPKTKQNGSGKLKIEAEVGDILNALYELDKKEFKTRFLSENMVRIPPYNPGESTHTVTCCASLISRQIKIT